jgi:flavorubredoxin
LRSASTALGRLETKGCVIYDSRYGNTAKIGRALAKGLNQSGIDTMHVNVREATLDYLAQCDLICVGAPTEAFSASKPMKQFLKTLKNVGLTGKYGFAFDTKVDSRLSGSAAKFIEKELAGMGIQMIVRREYAYVYNAVKGEISTRSTTLKPGEEMRFERIGMEIGRAVIAAYAKKRDSSECFAEDSS